MITDQLVKLLQEQAGHEEQAARIYRQMALICKQHNLTGAATFFEGHAIEEYEHMQMFADYLLEQGYPVMLPAQESPALEYEGLIPLVEKALKHEQHVTALILKIHKLCEQEGDPTTQIFVDSFVEEQHEEEVLFTQLLGRLKLLGDDPRALWYQDQEILQTHQKSHAASE